MAESPFLTPLELSRYLRVSLDTVRTWTRDRSSDACPCYRNGRRYLFDPHEAEAWFRQTHQKERLSLSPGRSRRVPAVRRRRAPNIDADGQQCV